MSTFVPNKMDAAIYSDLYKDVNGFRPRGVTHTSQEDFDADFARLQTELECQMDQEKQAQERNIARFEARVTETIELGAGDRATAIRWIMQAEDAGEDYGDEELEYKLNIPFGYINKTK